MEMLTSEPIDMIGNWTHGAKLQIAHNKSDMLLVSSLKAVQRIEITVGEHAIPSLKTRVEIPGSDDRQPRDFNSPVECKMTAKVINAVTRKMPNYSGPSSSKRRLLASVSSLIVRYGDSAWVAPLETSRT
ncbi:uncharacterized protein LOC135699812 [Ochlerotatus camptorhynchus]|uniref:uncharacterized protein LOC135699812 n=1 Tax=Ochlerotatus camptorhynchus TaxID=644619 RepID=UPI0031D01914